MCFPTVALSDNQHILGEDMPRDPLFHVPESSDWELLMGELR